MLNRSLTTQLLLTLIAVGVWGLYLGSRYWWRENRHLRTLSTRLFYGLLTAYAIGHILFVGYAWLNRANFPLNLETMELLKLQHVRRLLAGLPIYVEPSSEFIPLVYNPLYYYLAVPFTWLFGTNLLALRVTAIVGALGAYIVTFLAVRQIVQRAATPLSPSVDRPNIAGAGWENWWGLMAVGLMAAAFRVMDTYLDNAAADSWTLFTILLGCYLISLNRSRLVDLLGVLSLIAAFWLKQYGAFFTIGAVLYLTWRDGVGRAWPHWVVATLLGPLLYLLMPAQWMGPAFHYYTWNIPKQWVEFSIDTTLLRVIKFIVKYFGWLALTAGLFWLWQLWRTRKAMTIWSFLLPCALLSGPYVALDPGNNNNVFIPMEAWLVIVGVIGLYHLTRRIAITTRLGVPLFLFAASFALLAYNPTTVLVPRTAAAAYADLVATVEQLDGAVYAPGLGQLQDRNLFYPTVHWVTL
ncbi:MAG: hypothetical protein KDE19_21050, partial [Caldilineaceae bacterium]|nr:hypothetical protein [Caldilineaceae bacterium]